MRAFEYVSPTAKDRVATLIGDQSDGIICRDLVFANVSAHMTFTCRR